MEFGYRFIVSPRRFSCKFNGERIDNGLQQMVLSMITIYDVDQNGRLLNATGISVGEEINPPGPEPIRPLAAQTFRDEALLAKHKAEWDARYADLLDKELDLRCPFNWTSGFVSPNGLSTTFHGTTVVLDEQVCDARKYCRLRYAYVASPEGVRRVADQLLNGFEETHQWRYVYQQR